MGSEEGTLPGLDQSDHYTAAGFSSMPEAEGMWLILGIELANDTGDLAMLSTRLLKVTDAQGGRIHHGRAHGSLSPHLQRRALETTEDLVSAIRSRCFAHICISAHPERWANSLGHWIISAVTDLAANQAKRASLLARNR